MKQLQQSLCVCWGKWVSLRGWVTKQASKEQKESMLQLPFHVVSKIIAEKFQSTNLES